MRSGGNGLAALLPVNLNAKNDTYENEGHASGNPVEPEVAIRYNAPPDAQSEETEPQGGVEVRVFTCPDCNRTFASKIGLGVHRRRAHPVEVNRESAPAQVKRRWSSEEVALVARTEARLRIANGGCENVQLLRELPNLGRTLEALKGKRKTEAYKTLVREFIDELTNANTVSGESESSDSASCQEVCAVVPSDQPEGSIEVAPSSAEEGLEPMVEVDESLDMIVDNLLARADARKSLRADSRTKAKKRGAINNLEKTNAEKPLSARKRRRLEYARVQHLFKTCRSRAAAEVIDGQTRGVKHSLEELEAYWRPLLEAVSEAPGPTPEALSALGREELSGGSRDYSSLWTPVTSLEVKASNVDSRSASGPDGITPDDWRAIPVETQARIFTSWMSKGEIPERLRQCRTIFVPKKEVPAVPEDYRPISIASVPLRHLHTILARRLEACCPPDIRQRGFICADGTLENSAVLDAVLGDCREKLRECHVAVLDFSKAFDKVSHDALIHLLRMRGLPVDFCNYVARLYETANTNLAVNGLTSGTVRVGRGVRQGDPLSPLLFNMAMDLVLANLPEAVGYGLEGEKISALAYADDLVLLASSKLGLQGSIDCVCKYGQMMGLQLNQAKSAVLSMVPDGKRKKMHYLEERSFKIGKRWLKQVSCVERWRYLGIDFKAAGAVMIEQDIKQALKNITRAPLKPQQRLEVLRGHLVPRFLHGFVLGNISDGRLSSLDVQIRAIVRKWMRLPLDVPIGYFHATIKDGGLAIPSLRTCVPDLILRRFGCLDSSGWGAARAAAKSLRIRRKVLWAEKQFRKFSREDPKAVEKPRKASLYWRETLHKSVDGLELRESVKVPASTKWISQRCEQYTGRDYVQFVHTHINALPSRIRNSRGRRDGCESEYNCRAGCMVRETTAHCIQQCFRTHGGRIERHNKVARYLAKDMAQKGWIVEEEPRINTDRGIRKPDIIAVRGDAGVIVDVQIVSGQRPLDDAHRDKRTKYGGHEDLVEKVAAKLGLSSKDKVRTTSCTLSWRGVWSLGSYKELRSLLGLKECFFQIIPSVVLRGSHMNWSRFNRATMLRSGVFD